MSASLWQWRHALRERASGLQRRCDRARYPQVFAGQLADAEAGAWMAAALEQRRPVLVGRLGAVEARLIAEARFGRATGFSRTTRRQAHRNAGIFPLEPAALAAAAERLQAALQAVDLLAVWDSPQQARVVAQLDPLPLRCGLSALEPWWQPAPWSAALAGRTVLVVHPFAASIERQWQRRERLFADPQVLPPFSLRTLRPPLTLAGHTEGHSSWCAALDGLIAQVSASRFDVALLGCGAYGLPLAAAIRAMGRPALHLGGALQLLFGIRGRRWEAMPPFAALMNEAWSRPLPAETPAAAGQVDGGCYW
jgi:hypothetical protein